MSFNLREFEFRVVRIHAFDFFPSRRSQDLPQCKTKTLHQISYSNYWNQENVIIVNKYLNNLYKLIDTTLTREQGLSWAVDSFCQSQNFSLTKTELFEWDFLALPVQARVQQEHIPQTRHQWLSYTRLLQK